VRDAARHRGRCAFSPQFLGHIASGGGWRAGRAVRQGAEPGREERPRAWRPNRTRRTAPWRRPVTARARTVTVARQVNGKPDSSSRRTHPVPVCSGRVQTSESARLKFPPRMSSMLRLE